MHKYLHAKNADVFAHGWLDEDKDQSLLQQLQDTLNPTVSRFERMPPSYQNESNRRLSNAYTISESMKLMIEHEKKTGQEYDIVVSLRFDICYNEPLDVSQWTGERVFTQRHQGRDYAKRGDIDFIWGGSPRFMKSQAKLFDYLKSGVTYSFSRSGHFNLRGMFQLEFPTIPFDSVNTHFGDYPRSLINQRSQKRGCEQFKFL